MSKKEFFARSSQVDLPQDAEFNVFVGDGSLGERGIEVKRETPNSKGVTPINIILHGIQKFLFPPKINQGETLIPGGDDNMAEERNQTDVSQADELFEGDTQERSWDNLAYLGGINAKRTYDAYQDLDLARARADLAHSERLNLLAENSIVQVQTHQADLNAQKVRHTEIAIENQWESAEEVAMAQVAAHIAADHASHD